MVSGLISDAQISASSYADRGWVAENARLLTGRSGWTGQQTRQPFRNEWLQVSDERVSERFWLLDFFSQVCYFVLKLNPSVCSAPPGRPGPGKDGDWCCDPGRETPRQKRLHEEVQGGPQSGRGGLDHHQGGQQQQAQGWQSLITVLTVRFQKCVCPPGGQSSSIRPDTPGWMIRTLSEEL